MINTFVRSRDGTDEKKIYFIALEALYKEYDVSNAFLLWSFSGYDIKKRILEIIPYVD